MAKQTVKRLTRRDFIKSGSVAAAGIAAMNVGTGCSSKNVTPVEKSHPNILLIITDQQNAHTIAANGCGHVKTPALDRLVEDGVSFTDSYCTNPLCSPSRSSIFSGRTSSECGVIRNEIAIRSDIPSLGEWFSRKSDYETIYTGKWHLPATYTADIPGFSVPETGLIGQGNYCDTGVAMACEAYLRNRSRNRPFLMVASFMQPHDICEWLRLNLEDQPEPRYPAIVNDLPELPPNFGVPEQEPEDIRKRRQRDEPARGKWSPNHWRYYLWSYYRHIEMVDAEIGRMLQALEDTGQRNDTVVIFIADHGEGCAHHSMVRKSTPYEEASKVPLVISWPGEYLKHTVDSYLVSGVDIMPTLCDFAGIQAPLNMRGKSLRPVLDGRSGVKSDFIALECSQNLGQMIRTERYKYVAFKNDPVEQLFDMQNDPYEMKNLAVDSVHASVMDDHRTLLRDWISHLDIAPDVPADSRWYAG